MHQGETSALESRAKWWWCGVGGGELWDLTFIPYLESKMLVLRTVHDSMVERDKRPISATYYLCGFG